MAEHMQIEQPSWGEKVSKCCLLPQRVIVALMGFLCIVNCYTTRICLSHAITVLVIRKNTTDNSTSSEESYCPRDPDFGDTKESPSGIYDWSEQVQGIILGAFYVGYLLTHLPGGILTDKYGGKWVLTIGMAFSAIASIFSPLAITQGGPWALAVMRGVMGIGQGVVFPALGGILACWVPAKERGKLGALVMGGGTLGSIVANSLSGVLLKAFAWPIVFIFFGGLTFRAWK
ncbi:putative inorganic phosphate cotransporter [Scaptodrosophila lebanonensis]|uniref:Inorganic phosphate cotransporter n=1 Tax=Drosophila lebanonensis TaxID=7225 RepID=A0A6J2U7L2_DROLE|nr:putative inorganic phosphate cotransporter [Scaptodrosophila lebanonensis]